MGDASRPPQRVLDPSLVRPQELPRETQHPDLGDLRERLEDAPRGSCPKNKGLWLYGIPTRSLYPISCRSWSCPHCCKRNAEISRLLIDAGIRLAFERGDRCRFLTLTTSQTLSPQKVSQSFNAFRTSLSRTQRFTSYASSVEIKAGHPHLHVVLVGGRYVEQRRLSELAGRAGFGDRAWIRNVENSSTSAERVSGYLVKSPLETKRWASAHGSPRFRPVRFSANWQPCGLTEAHRRYAEAKGYPSPKGPFLRVSKRGSRISIREIPKGISLPEEAVRG